MQRRPGRTLSATSVRPPDRIRTRPRAAVGGRVERPAVAVAGSLRSRSPCSGLEPTGAAFESAAGSSAWQPPACRARPGRARTRTTPRRTSRASGQTTAAGRASRAPHGPPRAEPRARPRRLCRTGSAPPGMVRVPVSTAQRLGPSLDRINALFRSILDARTYGRIHAHAARAFQHEIKLLRADVLVQCARRFWAATARAARRGFRSRCARDNPRSGFASGWRAARRGLPA